GKRAASTKKGGLTEEIRPAISAEDVPSLSGQRDYQRNDEEIECDIGVHNKRYAGQDGQHANDWDQRLQARAPNRPLGRTSSTMIKIRKMTISPTDSPRYRA